MPIMLTFGAGRVALIAVVALLAAGCGREQQDWRSAEAADTSEAYARFVEQHPDSELAVQARARLVQLAEERDWAQAGTLATADAYRAFLAAHPSGRWSEEARIRIEAFSLGSMPRLAPSRPAQPGGAPQGPSGVRALQVATAPPAVHHSAAPPAVVRLTRAEPTEARARSAARTGGNSYGVQLGAFGSEASADREWRRLQGRFGAQLGGLSPRIITGGNTAGPLYRLQAPTSGEAQARALCDSLREKSQPCVPVLPH
ncbi:MAG: SPOR domain-containing protein [Gammaproteobacteria bacterium]|nr:MAG: SPOR domain-containing protein [Gammaproteobacteria bacterium]TLZ40037.1 MAG: SPOR domain-containing protein [Gammaproteobacteria bacterium]